MGARDVVIAAYERDLGTPRWKVFHTGRYVVD